jgi:hypothetical protein
LNTYSFLEKSFTESCIDTAQEIKNMNRPIYVSFSGGMDSEYVVRTLRSQNVPFTVLTIKSSGNNKELEYVKSVCDELNIVPTYITMTDGQYVGYHKRFINSKYGVNAPGTTPLLLIQEYVLKQNNNGILVTGEEIVASSIIDNVEVGLFPCVFEYAFYTDYSFNSNNTLIFLMYNPATVLATIKKMPFFTNQQELKSSLYNIPKREKFKYEFSEKTNRVFNYLNKIITTPSKTKFVYTTQELTDILSSWSHQ